MLCDNCQAYLRPSIGLCGYRDGPLHYSLLSFYRSIASGCLICRQSWYSIIKSHQHTSVHGAIYANVDERSSLRGYRQFRCQVQHIKRMTNRSMTKSQLPSSTNRLEKRLIRVAQSFMPRTLQLLLKTFRFKSSDDLAKATKEIATVDCYVTNLGDGKYMVVKSAQLQLRCFLILTPSHGDKNHSNQFGERDFEVNGTSTAAMPQLWNHWLRSCSESHLLCNTSIAKDSFTPNRLIEIFCNNNNNNNNNNAIDISWRLVNFNSTTSVTYVTLSHC